MKLTELKCGKNHFTDIDCSDSSAVKDAWFKVEDNMAQFQITYASGAKWVYRVPVDAVLLVGLGMESVGRFVNLVLKPNANRAFSL